MDFRSLLLRIDELKLETFTSAQLASFLGVSCKRLSDDLRRLYKMGFLKKKRVKRSCLSSEGKLCHKGYEYEYSVSKQGASYINWFQSIRPIEDASYVKTLGEVLAHLPEELVERLSLIAASRLSSKYRGPTRNLRFLDNPVVPIIYLLQQNKYLTSSNRGLLTKNFELNVKNDMLQLENLRKKTEIEGLEKGIEDLFSLLKKVFKNDLLKDYWVNRLYEIQNMIIDFHIHRANKFVILYYLRTGDLEGINKIILEEKAELSKISGEIQSLKDNIAKALPAR